MRSHGTPALRSCLKSLIKKMSTQRGCKRITCCNLRVNEDTAFPSLARPSLPHRLDCKGSKIFVHPVRTRLDVCNGHTRSLSHCHLVWWTSAQESRRKSKTLHKPDAAPRREHPIDVTRGPVADESRTCRQHTVRAQGRVFNRACSRCTQEDRRCDPVPCQQKHRFLPSRAFMTAVCLNRNRPSRDGHHIGRPKQGLPKRRPPLGDYR